MSSGFSDLIDSIPLISENLYCHNEDEVQHLLAEKPWKNDPHYFQKVMISAVALIKIATHAHSGGNIEIMGLMTGKVIGKTFWLLDAFPLPVEGTETRVNAGDQANVFMISYMSANEGLGRLDNVVAWYHSHPGYSCWLSGIDVQTTQLYQKHQDPICAVVIDPFKTLQSGKVDVGAFRTYPENYVPPERSQSRSFVPADKINDFGSHWKKYYSMEVEFFRSEADELILKQLWNENWAAALSSNPALLGRRHFSEQIMEASSQCSCLQEHKSKSAQNTLNNTNSLTADILKSNITAKLREELFAPIDCPRP